MGPFGPISIFWGGRACSNPTRKTGLKIYLTTLACVMLLFIIGGNNHHRRGNRPMPKPGPLSNEGRTLQ